MKIGILTLPFNNNYGGLLQAYALQSYLRQKGHNVYSIQQPVIGKVGLVKHWLKSILKTGSYTISGNMRQFQRKNMSETFYAITHSDFNRLSRYNFDAVIVGSDQVWRFKYTKEVSGRYFFDFITQANLKKISFAASFGVDNWEATNEQTRTAAKCISEFDAVSVREKSAVNLCKEYLNFNSAIHLLDPTLLMPRDFYKNLYDGTEIDNSGKIGFYFLDDTTSKKNLITKMSDAFSLTSFSIGKKTINSKKSQGTYYPPVSQWIKDFETSKYIITDSFHGVIFSILFRKSFCVIGNKERGLGRFTSLLQTFSLEDRLMDVDNLDTSEAYQKLLKNIDYSPIDEIIKSNMQESDIFLQVLGI